MNKKYLVDLTDNYEETKFLLYKVFDSKYSLGSVNFFNYSRLRSSREHIHLKCSDITFDNFCKDFYPPLRTIMSLYNSQLNQFYNIRLKNIPRRIIINFYANYKP